MATWTDVPPGEVVPGAVNKSAHMQAALDNTVALSEGATGAPSIKSPALRLEIVAASSKGGDNWVPGQQISGDDIVVYELNAAGDFFQPTGTWVFLGAVGNASNNGLFWKVAD